MRSISVSTKLILFLGVFGVSLFGWTLGSSPILISDIALIGWVLTSLLWYRRLNFSLLSLLAWLFLFFSLLGFFVLTIRPSFVVTDYLLSLVRLCLSVSLIFTVSPIIRMIDLRNLGRAILWVLRLHALIIIAMVASNLLLGTQLYRFANLGNYTPETFLVWGRISGLFAEPAYFGWFIALGLFTLLNISIRYKTHTISLWDYLLFLLALLFSTSLAGVIVGLIALFSTVCVHLFYLTTNIGRKFIATSTLSIGLIVVLILFAASPTQGIYFFNRISNVGTDASFQDRIPGSLEAAYYIFLQNPLTGTGLGNLAQSVEDSMPFFIYKWPENTDIHISWAGVFATTGLFGGITYITMLLWIVFHPGSRPLGWGLILVSFVYGGFALGILWWFMALTLAFQKPRLKWRTS